MSVEVSVVVPTYSRPDLLRRCLQALLQQEFPSERYEIVVVDNAGSGATRALVEGFAASAGSADANRAPQAGRGRRPQIYYLRAADRPGPAAARNAGWRFAHGDIMAFTDDDCVPRPRWLAEGVEKLRGGYDCVTGRVVVPIPEAPTDYEKNTSRLATAEFLTANCFLRCRTLQAIGGFDERFAAAWREDSDLQFSMLESDCALGVAPAAMVEHPVRPAAWGVSLKEQRKSMYNALLFKKHPALYRGRIEAGPPWRYYAIVVSSAAVLIMAVAERGWAALAFALVWAVLTGSFLLQRLRGTSRAPGHVAEMVVTSVLIPPLSIYWRLYGAARYRVWFC